MLFKAPLPTSLRREGLFVPDSSPRRPDPWVILAMTVSLLLGFGLLMFIL